MKDIVADLALVFGWTEADIEKMPLSDLYDYHARAVERVGYLAKM